MNVKAQQVEDVYELSPLQQGMLFHTLQAPDSGMYYHQAAYTLNGSVDASAFHQAWQQVVNRHAVLRTSFHWDGLEKPLQVVHRQLEVPLQEHDWRGLAAADQEARLGEYLAEARRRGFVLSQAPLIHLTLIRLADDVHQYIFAHHHMLWDGWSGPLILKEFLTIYESLRRGQQPRLPPPRPYRDYIAWLQKQDPAQAEAFWRTTLQGISAPTPLVMDHSAGIRNGQPDVAADQKITLTEELSTTLKALARKSGLTLNTIMQGAWALLLSRYSGQQSVLFGTSVSGRPAGLPGVESIVGLFINTLPVRIDVIPNESLIAWLKRIQNQQAEQRLYEYSPLVHIHGWSEVPRGVPLFETMFVFENFPTDPGMRQQVGSLGMKPIKQKVQKADYPLVFVVMPLQSIMVRIVYAAGRFDQQAIEQMLRHFQLILESMVRQPEQSVDQITLLSAAERQHIIHDWNQTVREYPRDRCVHQLFEDIVAHQPNHVALLSEGQSLTYRELDQKANQLAIHLRSLGVKPEHLIGVSVERTPDMIIAILGVLKAGCAYVPLDPGLPVDRLSYMLEDTAASVVLTQQHLCERLPEFDGTVICLDSDWPVIARKAPDKPPLRVSSRNLVYVIYTSGSTGRPKGVLVEHQSFVNNVLAQARTLSIGPGSRVLHSAPFSSDASQSEIFRALTTGATLCLESPDALMPGPELLNLLRNKAITMTTQPAPVLAAMPRTKLDLPSLKTIIIGGDTCTPEAIAHYSRGRDFFNGYGPTETTVCATMAHGWDVSKPAPLGRPLANVRVYVLDKRLRPAPIGVPGELYIGGEGVTRGYLNQPHVTAAVFLPDAFCDVAGSRMYKTGDRVYWTSDGQLHFLGRVDEQVKIRGFRIELGEIETTLHEHPGIVEAVVLAKSDSTGNKRLIAYIVGDPNSPPSVDDLRTFVKRKLPEYMVPSLFIALPAMPKTAYSKVDRKALLATEAGRIEQDDDFVPPRNPAEEMVAGIWADILSVERVGVFDNFFTLGGHSLMATQVMSRVKAAFNVDVPLRALFEEGTVAALTEKVDKARRQAALKEQAPPLVRVDRDRDLPLSFAQQRLWFFDQLEPGNLFYNLPNAIRLTGKVDVDALRNALTEIVRRHEVLRTSFANRDGQPMQVIAPAIAVDLPLTDISDLDSSEREAKAKELATAETRKPFNLSTGPLFRAGLVRLGPDEHILLVAMHHIITDGWSMGSVFFRELATLYRAFSAGAPSSLSALPVQYADFALWQRQWLQGETLEKQLAYWREKLAGVPPVDLPTDRPRPVDQTFHGAHKAMRLPAELGEQLQTISRREGATLFMTLLAAFQAVLSRYSGQDDVAVGTPIAGRNHPEIEGLIGFFVNTLVIRTDLSGNPTVKDLIGRVRQDCLGAYDHQDVPFEKLVEELQQERDMSRSPLFQVMFVHQNAPKTGIKLGDLTLAPQEMDRTITAKFDLTLSVTEGNQGLGVVVKYNTDLFDAQTMERFLNHYRVLLETIASDPEKPIASVGLLTDLERTQILGDWSHTTADFPVNRCIHELFEAKARECPDALAFGSYGQELPYRDLNRRANRLARQLQSYGVGPEKTVALLMERSPEVVLSVIAVLKAGGAYVPLDPRQPEERLSYMVRDSAAQVLMTQPSLQGQLPHFDGPVICVDEIFSSDYATFDTPDDDVNPQSGVGLDNLAYIMFTSGSTGQPKGVLVHHRGLANVIQAQNQTIQTRPYSRVIQYMMMHFDASQAEIFRALSVGAALFFADPSDLASGPEMTRLLRNWRITNASIPPALLAPIPEEELPDLHQLTIGGEAGAVDKLRFWSRGRKLVNGYGPTETTICATIATGWDINKAAPIGRPIANARAYLLDPYLQLVPVGVPGELCIGGIGVTRGYMRRPDLTATVFVPDPFCGQPGARMYRTGDRVRWLPDGQLDFLGRVDGQIKIRGIRIELGEIEAVLGQHPELKDHVVVARDEPPGPKRLVAYLVADKEPGPTVHALREFLKSKLPEHLIPSAFVYMPKLPRAAQGKVNRRALPAPVLDRQDLEREYVPARNATEEVVAGVWAELLHTEQIGVHDNFFELGGHSLLATQVVSRLRSTFQVEVPLRLVFKTPTVAGLAENIERLRRAAQGPPAPPLVKLPRDGHLPLSFAQQRLWFFDQLEPGNLFYNLPNAIRLTGQLNFDALQRALNEIVCRHESLRTTFAKHDGEPCQVIAPPAAVDLKITDIAELTESDRETKVRELATAEGRTRFDLVRGPLFRVSLVRLSDREHVLLSTMHHIITDGWSMGGIFFRELAMLYRAFAAGESAPLPEVPIQYADFAGWQRQWLQGEVLESQLAYWRDKLSSVPPLELPTDRPRPAEPRFRGNFQTLVLPPEFAEKLQALSRKEGVTLFMTLLAGFKALLAKYSGQDDIAVGTPIAGRNRTEIEGLIGFFVNTLVMRTDLSSDPTFRELLGRVRDTCLGAYDHQDIPFEKLVEELHPHRDLSRSPLFQVMFVLQNAPRSSMSLGDLTIGRQEADKNVTSRYDLTLSVTETERGLGCVVKYKTDLFDDETMRRFLMHFQRTIEGVADHPDKRLSELALLSDADREKIVVEWNQTAADYPRDRCVHQVFEDVAQTVPQATALSFQGATVSYAELDRRSAQLAHYLQSLGLGSEGIVAICMDRSIEMVVGILGILRAGAAYLPLDPSQPAERIAYILRDAGVRVLLAHNRTDSKPLPTTVVNLDRDGSMLTRQPHTPPKSHCGPRSLAYVIYTSGSTGQPKGVLVEHRGLMNVVAAQNRAFEITAESRVLQWVPIYFDASQGEIFRALTTGATLCLASSEDLMPGDPLLNTLRNERITAATMHPSGLTSMTDTDVPDLRTLTLGGGEFPIETAKRWAKGRKFFNGYGPTEATICSTLATGWDTERSAPIGRPIANTQVYVLDAQLRPVPAGIPGELYIGGDGVARGYLNRADLTASLFIPDPFSGRSGARLYRTGDGARWLFDGQLDFLGRVDEQVKIRGMRVELGEIENVLRQFNGVHDCAVIASGDTPEDTRLVAYVVAAQEPEPTAEQMRAYLKQKLPENMVPAAFVFLKVIPRKAHGKVDRAKLPAPEPAQRDVIPPRDALELQLVQIWEDVLKQQPIGVRDDFFELGGHSLLAVKLMDRVKATFDRKLSMGVLFRHPTIEGLAVKLREQDSTESPLVHIRPGGSRPPLFLIHPAEGNVLCYADLVRHLDTDIPVYGLQARGLTAEQQPHTRIEDMAADYISLIRSVQPAGPYWLGGWSTGGLAAYEIAQQLCAAGETVELIAMVDTYLPRPDRQPPKIDPGKRFVEFAKERGFELPADFSETSAAKQLEVFLERAGAANALPPGLGEEQIHRLQRRSSGVFQANLEAVQAYSPRPYAGRVVLFTASESPATESAGVEPDRGWSKLTPALEVHCVPGSHESMIKEPHAKDVAEKLTTAMSDAARTTKS